MKKFAIVIHGECANDVTEAMIHEIAAAAEVQVLEPELQQDDDPNPLRFETHNVRTEVFLQ